MSRVACLGKLKHSPIGYTGPLNRHLLAFTSAVATVRSALRDLMEMSIATLFLNADAERERDDLSELGLE